MQHIYNRCVLWMTIYRNRLFLLTRAWNWDACLPILAAILSMTCAIKTGGSKTDRISRVIVIGIDGYDVTRWSVWALVALGIALFIIAGKRLLGFGTKSFNKYLGLLVASIIGHFIIGLIMTEYKTYVEDTLSKKMIYQVEEMKLSQERFGVTFRLAELWDYMQIKMKCCGVQSYRDYGVDAQVLPRSCCVLKKMQVNTDGEQLSNWYQCRHDFSRGVRESMFLHTKGCHESLYSWFLRYTAAITGLLFGSISLQAISILYLSWQGFTKMNDKSQTHTSQDYEDEDGYG